MNREISHQKTRHEAAMRYLLDRLSRRKKARLEAEYFADGGDFEELEVAEDELIDRYVNNELSRRDRRGFEKLLVSPRIAERVEIARLLARRTAARNKELSKDEAQTWWQRLFGSATTSGFKPALAFAIVVMVLVGIALALLWWRMRRESEQFAAHEQPQPQIHEQASPNKTVEKNQNQNEPPKENQARNKPPEQNRRQPEPKPSSEHLTATAFLLPSVGTRSGGGEEERQVVVTKDTRAVNLNLDVEQGNYSRYDAVVTDDNQKRIHHCATMAPFLYQGRKTILCVVPARRLTAGEYNVHVNGLSESGEPEDFQDYLFRVVAR